MDTAPYYAPSYFPPSYFYASMSPTAAPPPGFSPYNAPAYFPPSYFYGAVDPVVVVPVTPSPPVVPVAPVVPARDRAAYAALRSILCETGAFESVVFGESLQRNQVGADGYPLAVVTPKGWEESDDYDPTLFVRRVFFAITIVIKSEDGCLRFDELDRLTSTIQDVVDLSDLRGTCLAGLTKIRSGRYGQATHYPEQSVELEGSFTTLHDSLTLLTD